jgi:hypothetical protein
MQQKFYPKSRWRFVLDIPGIDAFLVKSVARAPYINPITNPNKMIPSRMEEFLSHKKLVVTLHDSITPSAEQQVEELINNMALIPKVVLRLLDPVGTVIGERVYSGVVVERVDYDVLSYDSKDFSEIKLTLSFNSQKLAF